MATAMRIVAAFALLVLLLVNSSATMAQEKDESLEDAFTKGKWSMLIDLAPRVKDKFLAAVHDRPGKVEFDKAKDGKFSGKYSYKPGFGEVQAKFEGEVIKGDKLKVTFVEVGIIPAKGFGEFEVERDPKSKKIIRLKGWWKLKDIDPELKWYIERVEEKKDK